MAQVNLGQMYRKGEGVNKNIETAIELFLGAARQNNPMAEFNLGVMFEEGKVFPRIIKRLNIGTPYLQVKISQMLNITCSNVPLGKGVQRDLNAARDLWTLRLEQGHAGAQYNLGVMYDQGTGVKQDLKQAFLWYKRAAKKGYGLAQFSLGVMYLYGDGVEKDLVNSYLWFSLAEMNRVENTSSALIKVKEQMTSKDFNKAKKALQVCKTKQFIDC